MSLLIGTPQSQAGVRNVCCTKSNTIRGDYNTPVAFLSFLALSFTSCFTYDEQSAAFLLQISFLRLSGRVPFSVSTFPHFVLVSDTLIYQWDLDDVLFPFLNVCPSLGFCLVLKTPLKAY